VGPTRVIAVSSFIWLAAVLLALALMVIVPAAARAADVERGPEGIAVNASGDVYVSDRARNTVDEITPKGEVSIVAGIPGHSGAPTPGPATDSLLGGTIGLAVSKAGDLYISDFGNDVIEKVTPAGMLSIVAGEVGKSGTPTPGPATSSMLTGPTGIAVDSEENLYIADQGIQEGPNNVIEKVTPSGVLSIFAGELAASGEPTPGPATNSMLNFPQGVAVDGAGNVYIADTGNPVVEKVNTEGILSIFGEFYFPIGVATDDSGDVYVTNSNKVEEVDPAGQLSVIAGNGGAGEPTPGPAIDSSLDQPKGVGVDSAGNVYIPDTGNDMVEKVTPAGELSIIWATEDPIPGSTLTVTRAGSGSGTVTSSPSGIACPKTCFAAYEPDTPVTLTATPKRGSAFVGWEGSGCSGTGTCQVTMSSGMAVTATFQPLPPVTLTVALAGSGSGGVESSPADGIACPETCSHAFEAGEQVTLTATPAAGSRFVGWEGSGCSGTGTCQVTLGSEATVTATFEKLPALSVAIAGSGTGSVESSPSGIACPGTCSYAYAPGTPVTLTPVASAGSRFVGWEGSGCSGTGTCRVTLGSDTTVTAMFEKLLASPFERELPIQPFSPPASFKPPTTPTASVYLAGTRITTTSSKAGVKLTCSGTGKAMCSGELTLAAKSTTKRGRGKTETIGTATFSIQTGKAAIIELKLDAAGGALLTADHGRLKASLTILKSSPAPSQTNTNSVQLVQRKAHGKAKK
jgi:streptogramin lyase